MAGFPKPLQDSGDEGTEQPTNLPQFGVPTGRAVQDAEVAEARGGGAEYNHDTWATTGVLVGADDEDDAGGQELTMGQKVLQALTLGLYKPRKSPAELRREALAAAAALPLQGSYKIAVMSRKGGVGKTTSSVGIGCAICAIRKQNTLVLDCNPDVGSLESKMTVKRRRNRRHIRQLVQHLVSTDGGITPTDLEDYIVRNTAGLQAIVSSSTETRELSGADYKLLEASLRDHYPYIIADTGTNITSTVNRAILNETDALVLVTTLAYDEYVASIDTLGWLMKQGGRYAQLAQEAIVVGARWRRCGVPTMLLVGWCMRGGG